jgi:carboxypeptidase Q
MTRRILLLLALAATPLSAQTVDTTGAGALIDQAMNKSEVMKNLEYLTDVIGPRLTGSAAAWKANEWTQAQFRAYGLKASLEAWDFGIPWQRGPIAFKIESPFPRNLTAHSWAWTDGTGGESLTGPVVMVDVSSAESLAVYAPKMKGAWLMLRPPADIWNPDGPPMTAADSAAAMEAREARMAAFRSSRDMTDAERQARRQFFVDRNYLMKQAGALGVFTDGSKTFGLMTMSGSPYSVSPLPNVVIAHEDYSQFARLLAQGITPRVTGIVMNTFGKKPVQQWNTIGEIRGSEWPDQVVILGAHLDSWDLGTGATDNGTGSMVVLEAARAIKASGLKPKRTMRFVLFTGEEQGLLGSAAYAAAHANEADKIQAVLVLDNGTGAITGQALQGRTQDAQLWKDLLAPVASLGADSVRDANKGGTDHLSFIPYGVPGWNFDQLSRGYDHTHHSQVDTYGHAVPGDLMQASAVMAVTGYELANLPVLLPRGPVTPVTPRTIMQPSPGLVAAQ